jgi:thimet oligopeptidase
MLSTRIRWVALLALVWSVASLSLAQTSDGVVPSLVKSSSLLADGSGEPPRGVVGVKQPTLWATKPNVAAFEKIENEHLDAAQRSIDGISAGRGPRTIENTLAPYDEAIRQIDSAQYFADVMQKVHPDATFRDHATAMLTKASALATALSLNRDVYQALASLDVSKADRATRYYVQRTLLEFRLAGVDKDDATRARLKQLNDELTEEQSVFVRNIADGQRTVEVGSASDLDGLPQDYLDSHKPGPDGKIRITTSYPDLFPVMNFAKSDDLRHRLWIAFLNRAYPQNTEVLRKMMQTRYEMATLLGYPNWADYNAADKMIGKGSNIAVFIDQLDATARPVYQRELAMLLEEKRKTHPGATEIWVDEFRYYSELLRRAKYDFDSQSVRPYFPYKQVERGILDTAAKFFHVSFQQEPNAPAWDPAVETWDVFDEGKAIGRFYLDMHPRPGKYSHDAMDAVLDGIRGKQLPEAILICNFPQPTATDPGLMEYDDVTTFFHEFGHLMNHILGGQQEWAGISGITKELDFWEAPSQMLEELIRSPQVLALFAHHYKTGEPIPAELVAHMNRAFAFGRAEQVVAVNNAFSAIAYDIYKDKPSNVDLDAVFNNAAHRYINLQPTPGTHFYDSFEHLAGYSSAYYTYMWDEVIAQDFYAQFDPTNPLAGDAPRRYRRLVLEPGGSMSANDLVKNFLGRPQNMDAFRRWMNEEFQPTADVTKRGGDTSNRELPRPSAPRSAKPAAPSGKSVGGRTPLVTAAERKQEGAWEGRPSGLRTQSNQCQGVNHA